MGPWMTLFVVADFLVMAAVTFYLLRRRMLAVHVQVTRRPEVLSIDGLRALTEFANAQHERIGNYVQANWSGAPEQLAGVFERLLDSIEEEARAKGLPADRATLKSVVHSSLLQHRVGHDRDVREALDKVA
jgi:hypothetical protein